MTIVTYPLGTPRAAASRGGDCRARDLTMARNVYGHHNFATTTACRISNGLMRVTVGATGVAPSLTIESYRGEVTIGDVYTVVYGATYGGSLSSPAWQSMGTVTIDSFALTVLLTGVRLVRISPEAVTLRLIAPVMADAYITLRRGERMIRIQHGSTRPPLVSTTRRVRWTASPSPAGSVAARRVEEQAPAIDGFPRFVAALDATTVDAATFSLTSSAATTASFAAGVGIGAAGDRTSDLHAQAADATRARLVVV